MKLVVIIGAGAVGKMTVGQELAKITDLRLYHGHMDIELVIDVFGKLVRRVGTRIREIIFEEFAEQEIRLQRNITENRLRNKASKRNIEWSNANLLREDENYRLASHDGEIPFENYMKIDNSNVMPDVVAKMIKETFSL